jgi:hypothetical protein
MDLSEHACSIGQLARLTHLCIIRCSFSNPEIESLASPAFSLTKVTLSFDLALEGFEWVTSSSRASLRQLSIGYSDPALVSSIVEWGHHLTFLAVAFGADLESEDQVEYGLEEAIEMIELGQLGSLNRLELQIHTSGVPKRGPVMNQFRNKVEGAAKDLNKQVERNVVEIEWC